MHFVDVPRLLLSLTVVNNGGLYKIFVLLACLRLKCVKIRHIQPSGHVPCSWRLDINISSNLLVIWILLVFFCVSITEHVTSSSYCFLFVNGMVKDRLLRKFKSPNIIHQRLHMQTKWQQQAAVLCSLFQVDSCVASGCMAVAFCFAFYRQNRVFHRICIPLAGARRRCFTSSALRCSLEFLGRFDQTCVRSLFRYSESSNRVCARS